MPTLPPFDKMDAISDPKMKPLSISSINQGPMSHDKISIIDSSKTFDNPKAPPKIELEEFFYKIKEPVTKSSFVERWYT